MSEHLCKRLIYSLTSFVGAFLLFLVQPLAAKALLPVFGGSFMVWAVALAFFQGLLFFGYALVHLLFGKRVAHPGLLAFYSLVILALFRPLQLTFGNEAETSVGFVLHEVLLLIKSLGLPFFCLATTSIVLQRFWSVTPGTVGQPPYFLYSTSNAGSLGALLAFPFFIEPNLPVTDLIVFWNHGFQLWVGLLLLSFPFRAVVEIDLGSEHDTFAPSPWLWVLPTLASSALLGATTNVLTLDVASMPLIWILPLAAYLLSFIRAFRADNDDLAKAARRFHHWLILGFTLSLIDLIGFAISADIKIVLHLLMFYSLCYTCHATLANAAPGDNRSLTRYYLFMSLGGWIGASLVAFVIPVAFRGIVELPISLFLVAVAVWQEKFWQFQFPDPFFLLRAGALLLFCGVFPALANQWMPASVSFVISAATGAMIYMHLAMKEALHQERNRCLTALVILIGLLAFDSFGTAGFVRLMYRNYYGMYRVFDYEGVRYLQMGSTYHGHEALDKEHLGQPTMYYHAETVIGRFFSRPEPTAKKIGILGLGAGILAAYGKARQTIDYFEIDPDSEKIARKYFHFLGSSSADIRIQTGDGRLLLRKQPAGLYDLLLMDAFSSDAIPLHLLTINAISEYRDKLASDGLLLFHVSNRHVNLVPILSVNAKALGMECRMAENIEPDNQPQISSTRWVAMGSMEGINRHLGNLSNWTMPPTLPVKLHPWTDDFSNLLYALNL